jgi:hypothetical protein
MSFYIFNTTTGDIAEIRIKNHNHSEHIVKVMSNILGEEPYSEYLGEEDLALTIYLTSEEIDKLFKHAKKTDEDLAQIIAIGQLRRLRGIKNIHY